MNKCITCQVETSNPKFCSRSCSAKQTNRTSPKRKPEGSCLLCGEPATTRTGVCTSCKISNAKTPKKSTKVSLKKRRKREKTLHACENCGQPTEIRSQRKTITCSRSCASQILGKQKIKIRIERYLSGEWDGGQPCGDLSETIRNYILEINNYACSICGFNERHPSDNSCIIEVDHINGNGMDHRFENLKALCPNHHALTPNYRGRNIGNGRPVSYIRKRKETT